MSIDLIKKSQQSKKYVTTVGINALLISMKCRNYSSSVIVMDCILAVEVAINKAATNDN